ncbi:MAG: N-acetylmuramoyl-L-alanine amidase [Lachnospiraceae bacterium]|nr:N-acetylmuramoyl-L-alanine amidase [Lachnospiraceae bacterium]
MSDRLATVYIWITLLVSASVIAIMVLTGKPQQDSLQAASTEQDTEQMTRSFCVANDSLAENSLNMFLPAGTEEKHVTIENDYMNKILRICISKQTEKPVTGEWFYEHPLQINAFAEGVKLDEDANMVTISLPFESVFEWETKYGKKSGQNCLYVQLTQPKEKYERIVVLDAGHGGADTGYIVSGVDETTVLEEEELALAVVTKAGSLLEKEGIHVYYTRQENNPSEEERVALANETQADMLISVHADYADDTSLYGMRTIYNETYFIPNFASADLAYLLLEKVAASTNEKAIGFEPASGESYMIQNAMVPVAQLNIGYLSNKQEQKLLGREDYIDRIASGICDAVKAGYKEIEK